MLARVKISVCKKSKHGKAKSVIFVYGDKITTFVKLEGKSAFRSNKTFDPCDARVFLTIIETNK